MTFEEWDAITPDHGQPGGYINGIGSTMTIPSTRESRLRDYQNSLTSGDIDKIVQNAGQTSSGTTLLTDGAGSILDDSPEKTKFEISIAADGGMETKSQTTLKNGDSSEVKNKTTNGNSIIDSVLSVIGLSGTQAAETPPEEEEIIGTPRHLQVDPKQDNLTAHLLDGGYHPELYENPKYIIDGSGAAVPNPKYDPEKGFGMKSSAYPDTPEGDLNRAIHKTPYEYTQRIMENLKKDTDTPITAESFLAEFVRLQRLDQIALDSILDTTELPIVTEPESTGTAEEKEASKDMVLDAVRDIASEQPNELTRLNDFALWADGVSDDQAIREAEAILEQIANQTTVTDRFKKAMGVALGAMLFGDDFVTAMNTGLGVVADDYTAEAAAAKEAMDAQIELEKEIAKEQRTLQNDLIKSDYNSARDHLENIDLEKQKYLIKLPEQERKAAAEILEKNIDEGKEVMASLVTSMGDNVGDYIDLDGEWTGLLLELMDQAPAGFAVNINDPEQRFALNGVFRKYVTERKWAAKNGITNDQMAPMSSYAHEFFVKNELAEFTKGMGAIDANLIAPTRAYLEDQPFVGPVNKDGVKTKQIYVGSPDQLTALVNSGNEAVQLLSQKIKLVGAQGLGERGTTILLYKDFIDFRNQSFAKGDGVFEKMETMAYQKGWGPFTQFVVVHMADKLTRDNIGKNFDPLLANEPEEVEVRAMKMYMETGGYDLEQIKADLKANK